jgi:hypothetical protein
LLWGVGGEGGREWGARQAWVWWWLLLRLVLVLCLPLWRGGEGRLCLLVVGLLLLKVRRA